MTTFLRHSMEKGRCIYGASLQTLEGERGRLRRAAVTRHQQEKTREPHLERLTLSRKNAEQFLMHGTARHRGFELNLGAPYVSVSALNSGRRWALWTTSLTHLPVGALRIGTMAMQGMRVYQTSRNITSDEKRAFWWRSSAEILGTAILMATLPVGLTGIVFGFTGTHLGMSRVHNAPKTSDVVAARQQALISANLAVALVLTAAVVGVFYAVAISFGAGLQMVLPIAAYVVENMVSDALVRASRREIANPTASHFFQGMAVNF